MKSLRSNIYTGFAIIVVLLVAIGLIGYFGANQLNKSSTAMRQVSEIDATVGEIDRQVTELQLRVSRYMATGQDLLGRDIIRLNDDLIADINKQATSQIDPQIKDLFLRMSKRLPEYRTHFNSVIEERALRADLVQTKLPAQAEVIQKQLREITDSKPLTEAGLSRKAALLLCKSRFLQAERLLLRYYIAADAAFLTDALQQLDLAIESLVSLRQEDSLDDVPQKLTKEIKRYRGLAIRAVQATRSFLFLVNVVMAGEASEVTYFSSRLRTLSESQRDAISQEMSLTMANVRQVTGLGIGVAVALGVLIASRLGALILKPITALTTTFRQLASGNTVLEIPENQRKDEIGEMALAAEVFRQRNVEQRELLEKAESLANELKATNTELDSFAYVASHDLKSPLRGIRQLAAWIEEDAGHLLPEESVKHFQAMQSRVQRMESLLEDLLNFSRIERSKAKPETVDVNDLLAGIMEMVDNPHAIQVDLPRPLPKLTTIRISLEQVFLNIIGNAFKYNDKGAEGRVEISWENQEDRIIFQFKDNGPGIDPKHHERVFQMYQRVGDTDVDGSGMGLAIVKKQIESHKGSIYLDSNPDCGVTFRVEWPASVV